MIVVYLICLKGKNTGHAGDDPVFPGSRPDALPLYKSSFAKWVIVAVFLIEQKCKFRM